MKKTLNLIKGKGKIIIMPAAVIIVLLAIYVFNASMRSDSAFVYADDGTYIGASGTVENNTVSVSSEVIGTVAEIKATEGDKINQGDVIAVVENTALHNQHDQALINVQIAEKNIEMLINNMNNLGVQNQDMIQQAYNAYLSVEAEYQRVMEGASDDEIKQAEEMVKQTKTNYDYAKVNLVRSKELFEQQAISQSHYDEVLKGYNMGEAQYNAAVAQLNVIKSQPTETIAKSAENKMLQAKASYELAVSNGTTQLSQLEGQLKVAEVQLKQAENILGQTERELEKLSIKSPIDGIVNSVFVKEGELVAMGKLTAEIYNSDNIEIKAYISEANIGHIKVGQDVNLYVDSHGDEVFKGRVTRINNRAEFTPKNIQTKEERVNTVFEVKIEVLDSNGVVKSGMPVDVNIKID
jgi:HlyD family secretion protein